MRVPIAAVCVISTLISTASSLQCTYCNLLLKKASEELYPFVLKLHISNTDETGFIDCEGIPMNCTDGNVCASVYLSMTKYDQSKEIIFKRDCLEPKLCNLSESITTPGLKKRYSTSCCDTDNCSPAPVVLPPENNITNGVSCPACYSNTQIKCEAKNSLECTGQEEHCLVYERRNLFADKYPIFSMGCGTEKFCIENGNVHILHKPYSFEAISCTKISRNNNLKVGHFLWCLTCHDFNVNTCTDVTYLCMPDEDACVFENTRSIYDGIEEREITKRCGKSNECNRAGSIRSSNKTILINTTCCHQNSCNPPLPTLPSTSNDDNGLTCPACFIPNSDRCLGRNNLKCSGNERRCIHYMRTKVQDIASVTETLHGCTTDEICEAGSSIAYSKEIYYKKIKTDIMCSRAFRWSPPTCGLLIFIFGLISVLQIGLEPCIIAENI